MTSAPTRPAPAVAADEGGLLAGLTRQERDRLAALLAGSSTEDPSGCLHWRGRTNEQGYPILWLGDRYVRVHRLAYELTEGPVLPGLLLDHACHTADRSCPGGRSCLHRRCIRPAHLEPVSDLENVRRGRSPAAVVMRTGYCQRGHLVAGDNLLVRTYPNRRTERRCRICAEAAVARWVARDAERRRQARKAQGPRQPRTVCSQGHPMTEANTYRRPSGATECRTCRAAKPHRRTATASGRVA
ncbi:hypothetical protein GCM10027261_14370 [Geodermatophilus arenarius]|uniref:HNH endonuclease n=1 Tax=Geodermatophilus arenarius TaxID=1137990 RepID=A0ABV9LJ87_9ACTN